jgi:alkanesulfonate monooxygenase SsuD/methylene tetrahydromethanopterin reductase-like flavin-dependent oxidoreductase (luciferase family)
MKVGVFDHLDNATLPMAQFMDERLALIEAYERAGFYAYHLAEHHGTQLGMAPSPNVFLAAIAMRTTRLRFGPMVYALPLYHPLRLAQEICMLDQLSHGRLIVGFGRGSSPAELRFYGVDPAEAEDIFRRNLPIVLQALETGVYRETGRAAPLDEIELKVTCLQKPTPPVWYGVHSPESAERAALRGWQTISLDAAEEARACSQAYRRALRERAPAAEEPLLGLGRFIVVAETDREAEELATRAYAHWHKAFTHLARKLGSTARHPRPDTWQALHGQGKGVAGSPETVAHFLRAQMRESECNYIVGQFAFGDLSAAELATSLDLFTRRVMPTLS